MRTNRRSRWAGADRFSSRRLCRITRIGRRPIAWRVAAPEWARLLSLVEQTKPQCSALGPPRRINGRIAKGYSGNPAGHRTFAANQALILGRSCPLWVKSGHSQRFIQCPLYPQKRTLLGMSTMSALCQKPTANVSEARSLGYGHNW